MATHSVCSARTAGAETAGEGGRCARFSRRRNRRRSLAGGKAVEMEKLHAAGFFCGQLAGDRQSSTGCG